MKLHLLTMATILINEAISENQYLKYTCKPRKGGKGYWPQGYIPPETRAYKESITEQVKKALIIPQEFSGPIVAYYFIFTKSDKDVTNFIKILEDSVFEAIGRDDKDVITSHALKANMAEDQPDQIHVYLFQANL